MKNIDAVRYQHLMGMELDSLAGLAPWAAGCGHCRYGVIAAPDVPSNVPLAFARAIAFRAGALMLCDCEAGKAYGRFLSNLLNDIEDRPVHREKHGLIWTHGAPEDYVPGSWWAQVMGTVQREPNVRWEGE